MLGYNPRKLSPCVAGGSGDEDHRGPRSANDPDSPSGDVVLGGLDASLGVACVLVVDDYPDNAESTAGLLRLLGCRTGTAYSGAQAIRMAAVEKPDIILLDISMPGMCGFELAMELRRMLGSKVTLVALSAYEPEDSPGEFITAGFNHHLVKPAEPHELRQLLGHVRESLLH